MTRQVKELGDAELRLIAGKVRSRLAHQFGDKLINSWIAANEKLVMGLLKETFKAVREQLELEG